MSEAQQTDTSDAVTPYTVLGGEAALRSLVTRFYDLMASEPEYAELRRLHPDDLAGSADKLFMFLSGWLGGPPLYFQKIGHPMLRARHLPYAIGTAERDQWMACMRQAMSACGLDDALRSALDEAFARTADHMRNRQG